MSTRCLTVIKSRWEEGEWETLATIYRHHDGYLEGHGAWLLDALYGVEMVNGISGNSPAKCINGPGRLAAFLVSYMDEDGLSPSLEPTGAVCGQEYEYHVLVNYGTDGGSIQLEVFDGPITLFGGGGEECNNKIFEGDLQEFKGFLGKQEEE